METNAVEMPWPAPRTGAIVCRRNRPEHEENDAGSLVYGEREVCGLDLSGFQTVE